MREDICTIPVSEVFENGDGCPICRMKNMLEERIIDYILGAAMMEPDVRTETNKLGFCSAHLKGMMNGKKRLPLALILETHLSELQEDVFKKGLLGINPKKTVYKTARVLETCFVCDKVEWGMQRLIATMFKTYNEELDFRETFRKQDFICLPHYKLLMEQVESGLSKKPLADFKEDCYMLSKSYLDSLYEDVHKFTTMFDYRNATDENADWGNSRDSIERTYTYLTSSEDI